ncbi:unnamed protein product [Orchesella dallaii]|uniref:Nardilysin n=1 Tax=Orchesella dallaii TaxID=48710 RepID=A0ABP1PNF4_9HEXA
MSEKQQPALKGSQPCMKCCKPRRCPDSTEAPKSKKSSSPLPNSSTNTESCQDIIKSPLDQRSYKSITLGNGVRVMLISTFNVENEDEEIDATKPPCQVPELSEFNKTYLGYDNPAAKVKCACPCDKGKPCCGKGSKEEESRKGILRDIEANIKATCCGGGASAKHSRQSEEKKVSFDENLNQFRNAIERQSNPDDLLNYQNNIFNELQKRADRIKSIVDGRRKSKIFEESSTKLPEGDKTNKAVVDSTIAGSIQQLKRSGTSVLNQNHSETHLDHLDEDFLTNSTLSKHYPQPPSHSEGLHCVHSYPVGSSRRPTSNRPQLTSPYNSDLDGTVYLVIGSNKFPEPNQLFKLVLPYEGYVNAYTSGMMTTFVTSASFRLFPLAVEILGDMVGFPLFPNSLVAAELEALDSEYSLRQDDTPRYFQLVGSLAKNGHVMRKMDSGNMSTLTVPNFYRKLVEWRRIYYNPSRMTVALEAPFPIDYLERLAISSFGKIAPAALPHINRHLFVSSPFEMNRFHQIYHVPSVYHSEFLALHWALEAKAWKSLRVKPLEYLGAIIGHKSDGGLFHYLTTQGLATNVEAGCWESDVTKNHFTSVFSISVDMTDKGFKRQDNILQAIFGYIQMLINNGPQKSFFQELQKQQLDSFHYQAAENSICIGESCARWMQFIPPKWCLISPALMAEFDVKTIQRYTESLKVETANVIIFSKNYRSAEYMRNMEEFYNTPFAAFHFPPELEEKMHRTKDEYSKKFTLPVPNPLLLETKCSRSRQQDMLQKGTLLKIKGKLVVQYVSRKMKISRGLLPQAKYTFWIGSPIASYVGAPEGNSTKMIIWSRLFNEIFKTKFYHASNADIQLETEISQGELHIILAGPHTMLPSLMEQTFQLFNDFANVLDPVQFDVVRTTFIENLDNTILDNRFLAWDLFYYLWTNNHDLIFDHKRYAERMFQYEKES